MRDEKSQFAMESFQYGLKQFPSVWSLRILENFSRGSLFHNFPVFHHQDAMTQSLDHLEVMTDEEIAESVFFLQFFK